jgi:protein-tyrosine-phosphatase
MEAWHIKDLNRRFPEHKDKLFLLALFENNKGHETSGFYRYNIEDPYGKDLHEFKKCFRRIERCIEGLFEQLEKIQDSPRSHREH